MWPFNRRLRQTQHMAAAPALGVNIVGNWDDLPEDVKSGEAAFRFLDWGDLDRDETAEKGLSAVLGLLCGVHVECRQHWWCVDVDESLAMIVDFLYYPAREEETPSREPWAGMGMIRAEVSKVRNDVFADSSRAYYNGALQMLYIRRTTTDLVCLSVSNLIELSSTSDERAAWYQSDTANAEHRLVKPIKPDDFATVPALKPDQKDATFLLRRRDREWSSTAMYRDWPHPEAFASLDAVPDRTRRMWDLLWLQSDSA